MKKPLRLGTDISLETCRKEGYLTVQYRADLDTDNVPNDEPLRFGRTYPRGRNGLFCRYETATWTPQELFDEYLPKKKDVDLFGDCDHTEPPKELEQILWFADTMDMWSGISLS